MRTIYRCSISVLLSLLIIAGVFAALPITAFAETTGNCGDSVTWSYDEDSKTLTFTGSGAIWDYDDAERIKSYPTYAETVVFGEGITRIGNDALYGFANLTSVTMADTITEIGKQAFGLCYYLTTLDFSDSVRSIGEEAFYACRRIQSIHFSDELTEIGEEAFLSCNSLQSVDLSNTKVRTIGDSAFEDCRAVASVSFPQTLKTIGKYAFESYNTVLTTVTIPESVTEIQIDAFKGCEAVDSVYCYPNPENLSWKDGDCDDFKPSKATYCYVPSEYLEAYKAKFENGETHFKVNVTFEAIPVTYTLVPYAAPDIFTKGNIEHYSGSDGKLYTKSGNTYTEVSQSQVELLALIDKPITAGGDDVIANNNPDLAESYIGGRFLGFQKAALNGEDTKTNSLRFVTEISSEILEILNNDENADYGFVFVALSTTSTATYDQLTVENSKARVYSCKDTTNTVSGDYGDTDFYSTEYKYITAGINDIPSPARLAARFYITYKGETHYINYKAQDVTGLVFYTSTYFGQEG